MRQRRIPLLGGSPMKSLRRLLTRLLPGDLGRKVAKGAGVVLAVQVAGAGLSYLTHIVLARILDPAGYGVYSYVMAWTALLAIPAALGLNTGLVRFVSHYREQKASRLLRGVTRRSWQLVLGTGTLIAVCGYSLAAWVPDAVSLPYAAALAVGVWLVPLRALLDIQVAMGRGLERMTLAYVPGQILRPAFLLAALALILVLEPDIDPRLALGLTVVTMSLVVLAQGSVLAYRIRSLTSGACPNFETRRWLRVSLPMLLIAGFLLLLKRTDVIMLGLLAGAEDVGTYNAAARTANLASFVLIAVNAIAAPTIASLYGQREHARLQELASTVAHFIFWPSLAIVIGLVSLAPFILGLFGSGFVAGQNVLAVLALGHLVNVGVGSVGYFMNMTGNQDEMAKVVGVSAVINLLLNGLAIPLFGALGAALATALSMAVWNVWLNRIVVARLSIRPSIVHAVWQVLGRSV